LLTDLPPAAQVALAAGQRVEVVDGTRTVALLVPVLPSSLSAAEAWAGLERLLAEVDASGRGETFRTIMNQEQERS
jgi:predicted nucleic acid-binding protein